MKIRAALLKAQQDLKAFSPTPDIDVLYLLMQVLNKDSAWILMSAEEELPSSQETRFWMLIEKRKQGIPIAYLSQTRGFWNLDLKVNESVLIPRPETELLVEWSLKLLDPQKKCRIADLGTGSGAIALSLGIACPHWKIDAVDIDPAALCVAGENAAFYKVENVHFYQGSWCAPLPSHDYDAILSNPPYLREDDPHLLQGDLRFEPRQALAAGPKGIEAYEILVHEACAYLKPEGLLFLEHGYDQRESLIDIIQKAGYQVLECLDDFQKIPRALIAKKFK